MYGYGRLAHAHAPRAGDAGFVTGSLRRPSSDDTLSFMCCPHLLPKLLLVLALHSPVVLSADDDGAMPADHGEASEATTVDPGTVVGAWSLTIEADGRELTPTLELRDDSGTLGGEWRGPMGEAILGETTLDEGVLRTSFVHETPNGPVTIRLRARIEDDAMEGEIAFPSQTVPFHGLRTAP